MSTADTNGSGEETHASPVWPWLVAGCVLLAVGFAWFFLPLDEWLQSFSEWVRSFGAAGVVVFALAYIIGTLLLVPGAPMTIAAGVAFGWFAIPLVLAAATVGATLAFLVSRYLARERVTALIGHRRRVKAVIEAVNEESWKILALLRLSPVVPFNLQNYLLGVTNVPVRVYLVSTALGIIPGTTVSVYLGVLGLAAGGDGGGALHWTFLGLGLVATVIVTVVITRKARAKLKEHGVS